MAKCKWSELGLPSPPNTAYDPDGMLLLARKLWATCARDLWRLASHGEPDRWRRQLRDFYKQWRRTPAAIIVLYGLDITAEMQEELITSLDRETLRTLTPHTFTNAARLLLRQHERG